MRTAAERKESVFAISALTGAGLEPFLAEVARQLASERHETRLHLSFADGRKRAWLHEQGVVESEQQGEDGFDLLVRWTDRQEHRFREM